MPDREKVAKGLQDAEISLRGFANHFPPLREECHKQADACHDALALLKETEAVVPKYNARTNWYECGACHYSMTSGMHCRSELIPATKVRYCANCGFPVNWEGR